MAWGKNDSERPKFWNLGGFWSCPTKFLKIAQKVNAIDQKVNECLLGPVTEPNGFKLDMHEPEGSIYPLLRVRLCLDGLEVQNFELLKSKVKRLKFDQKVNGIDQKVNDYLLGQIHMKRLKMVWIDHFWVHLNRLQLKIDLKFDLKFDLKSDLKFDLEFGKYWTFSKRQSCERSQKSKIAMKQTGIESNGLKMEQIHPLKGSDLCWRSLKAKFDMKIWLESENESVFWSSEDTNRPKWSLLNAWKTWQWFWDALGA